MSVFCVYLNNYVIVSSRIFVACLANITFYARYAFRYNDTSKVYKKKSWQRSSYLLYALSYRIEIAGN